MTASLGTIKRGATLSVPVRLHPVLLGLPVADVSGWTVKAELRREDGQLVAVLADSWEDAGARIVVLTAAASETATWPTARLLADIALTSPDGAVRIASPTLKLTVEKAITQ